MKGAVIAADLERTARGASLREDLEKHGVPIEAVSARVFAPLADTEAPQGIVLVIEPRRWTVEDLKVGHDGVVQIIDGVQDPGNVGTLLRTAHGLGARGTIALRGTADILGPKTLRAAMGANFRHPVVSLDDAAFIAWTTANGVTLWATAADGVPISKTKRGTGPVGVIVGNEGACIRPALNAVAAQRVAIPMAGGAESLNVAVAAGILLYEVLRGR